MRLVTRLTHARRFKVGLLPWLLFYLLVLLPVLIDLLVVLRAEPSVWRLVIPGRRSLQLLLRSGLLAGGTALISGSLGWLTALALWGRSNPRRGWLVIALALISLPPYIHTLSWIRLEGLFLNLSRLGGWSGISLFGWGGVLWVESSVFLPMTFLFSWLGLAQIAPELVAAARLAGPDERLVWRILLPLSAPAALTGVGLVYLLTLLEYGVPSLLGLDTYSMEVFSEFSLSASPGRALLVSLPLLCLAMAALLLLLRPLRQLALNARLQDTPWRLPPFWSERLRVLLSAVLILVGVQTLLPLFGLIWQVGGLITWSQAVWMGRADAFFSLQTSFLAGLLALPLAWIAAHRLLEPVPGGWRSWLIVLGPAALPASLIGIGLASLPTTVPGLLFLRTGSLLTAFGTAARFLPMAVLVMLAALRTVDPALLEAARVFQGSSWRRLMWVYLPLLSPGLLSSGGLIFVWGLGELGSALLTVPPGSATLTLRIYNYLHYGASQEVAGLCLLLVLGVFLVGGSMLLAADRLWAWLNPKQGRL